MELKGLRILYLMHNFQPGYGVSLVVKKQAEGLLVAGVKEIFIAAHYVSPNYNENPNLNIRQIGNNYHSLKETIIKINPDIIVVHTPPYFAHVAKFKEIDVIKIAYDHGEPFPSFFEGIERKWRENIDAIKYEAIKEFHAHISISEFIKRTAGINQSTVIYNGSEHIDDISESHRQNIDIRGYLGLDKNSFVITALSRIGKGESKYKGFEILRIIKNKVDKLIIERNITFLIIGKLAPGGLDIRKQLENEGFLILTDIDENLKREIIRNSDVFFSPSLWEGFNLPIIEAQYLGIPSIAFSTGAHSEVCPFHFSNIAEITQFIYSLYSNNRFHKKCAGVCSYYVRNKFKWDNNVNKFLYILNKLIEKKQKNMLLPLKYQDYNGDVPLYPDNNIRVLKDHIKRTGYNGTVENGLFQGSYKITYNFKDTAKISIIIPNKNCSESLEKCITSILKKSSYQNFEIIIIENNSTEENIFKLYNKLKNIVNIKIIEWNEPFNYSRVNNFGTKHVTGKILLFMNNDMEVINNDWLERLLEHALRKEIGAVGARLYYPNDTIQHAGVILGIKGIAGHSHKHNKKESPGFMGRIQVVQNLSAVTGACLMTRKEIFEEVGGFDEKLPLAFNDIDLCLKIRKKGYLIIYTPFAELYHYESLSRGYEDTPEKIARLSNEIKYMRKKWRDIINAGDPYYNKNLTLEREDFSIRI